MLRTVYFIYIFIYRMLRSPRSQIDIPMRIYGAPIPHCFIHLVISAANTQVDVFNLEMNVYCRVSVSYFQWCIHCRLVSMFALCSFNTIGYLIDWLNFRNNQIYLNQCWNHCNYLLLQHLCSKAWSCFQPLENAKKISIKGTYYLRYHDCHCHTHSIIDVVTAITPESGWSVRCLMT